MKRFFTSVLLVLFLHSQVAPLYAYSQIQEYLFEIGIKFYQNNRIEEALHEFKKSLMIQPDYPPALEYIHIIEQRQAEAVKKPEVALKPEVAPKEAVIPVVPPTTMIIFTEPIQVVATALSEVSKPVIPVIVAAPKAPKLISPPAGIVPTPTAPVTTIPTPPLVTPRPPLPPAVVKKELDLMEQKRAKEAPPAVVMPRPPASPTVLKKELDLMEQRREKAIARALEQPRVTIPVAPKPIAVKEAPTAVVKKAAPLTIIKLDDTLNLLPQPIEIEIGKHLIVQGRNIQKFLVTQPNVLTVERNNPDQLTLTGKEIGYTYVHFWADNVRRTIEFLVVPVRPKGPMLDEVMRREEERAKNFKLRYTMDWHSFESGRRLTKSLRRQSYTWNHNLLLTGATPYGDFNSTVTLRSLKQRADVTYLTMGLTDGSWGNFKGFSWRAFDFTAGFANLAYPNMGLRGFMLKSPAFNKYLEYTAFGGREGGGRYGNLSPGLTKIKNSFLEGINLHAYPGKGTDLSFTVVHGHGRQRPTWLNRYGYDFSTDFTLGKWKAGYEIGYDTEKTAHLLRGSYNSDHSSFTYELRDIAKNFLNMGGADYRSGERGGLFTYRVVPNKTLDISNRLSLYQDRLFPSLEDDNRLNQDYDFNLRYTIDPKTSLGLNYTIQNELGKITQRRYQSPAVNLSHTFNFIRPIATYLDLRHQENKNYSSPASSYVNEKVSAGVNCNLIGPLSYFASSQWNWLEEKYTATRSWPHVFETGVAVSNRIFATPFFENIRFTYRDEEDTSSFLSYLSGEDSIEGYAELTYRPVSDQELYCSTRIRNIWADNPAVNKRIEADFNAGARYLWDTGLRWEAVGTIEGYVFKDENGDGLRQRDEAPVEAVKIWLGKNKFTTTDMFGYYQFTKVKGRKAFLNIDANSLPMGFVLTVPQTQETPIVQGQSSWVSFGIVSRSEISGYVFLDTNADGVYTSGDIPVKDAVLMLETGVKANTGPDGRYVFRHAPLGEHTVTLDLNSLSVSYLPQVPLAKKIALNEGVTYIHNIPLKEIK